MHSAIHVRGRFWYSLYVSKLHGNIYTLTFNLICFLDGEAKLVVRITPKVVIVTKAVIWWCDHNNKTYTDLTITMFLLCVCSAIYWQFYLNYVPYWLTTEMGECRCCTGMRARRPSTGHAWPPPRCQSSMGMPTLAKMTLNVLYRLDLGDCYNLQVVGFWRFSTKLPSSLKVFEGFWPFQPSKTKIFEGFLF